MKQKAPLHKVNCHKDYITSPIHPVMLSPHTGQPMKRVYLESYNHHDFAGVIARGQFWKCDKTGDLIQDDEQKACLQKAAKLAAENPGVQTYYHTMAWRIGEGPDDVPKRKHDA